MSFPAKSDIAKKPARTKRSHRRDATSWRRSARHRGKVEHGSETKRAHGHAKVPQRRVLDVRDAAVAVAQERRALAAVRLEHAVADEAKGVAGQHRRLPEPLPQRHRRRDGAVARPRAAHVLEELHDVRGRKKVRADLCGNQILRRVRSNRASCWRVAAREVMVLVIAELT